MAICKRAGCYEPALPNGQRLCAAHHEARRKRAAEARLYPRCANCGAVIGRILVEEGSVICRACSDKEAAAIQRRREHTEMCAQFRAISTIDEMKAWLLTHTRLLDMEGDPK